MTISEILEKPLNYKFDAQDMINLVREYIYRRKNVTVEINLSKGINPNMINHPYVRFHLQNQHDLLRNAFETSYMWMKNNV